MCMLPTALVGKVRHCLYLFDRGKIFFSIWKVPISQVSLPFIPMILLPWNATEHAHVWSACIAVIASGAKKMKP